MEIYSKDHKRCIDVGSEDIFFSLYSTAEVRLKLFKRKIPLAMEFLKTGKYEGKDGYEVARQFNLLRDEFSKVKPSEVVYDCNDLKKKAPWDGKVSPVVTSAANFYTTADGKDLLYEIVSIMCYAGVKKTSVYAE